jgi:hypothetical protein
MTVPKGFVAAACAALRGQASLRPLPRPLMRRGPVRASSTGSRRSVRRGSIRETARPSSRCRSSSSRSGVRAEGWLLKELQLERDGFSGHLTEISKWCRFAGNAWVSPTGKGEFGWEEVPYWLRGFTDLGYVLDDKRIINESNKWTDGVLSSQDSTGYFGPAANRTGPDIWPNMLMLSALRSRSRRRVKRGLFPPCSPTHAGS